LRYAHPIQYNGSMYVLTAAQMRDCDRRTVEDFGIPWAELMENAGAAVAAFAIHLFPGATRITVLCGKGNNGGDGFVAARHLDLRGRRVRLVMISEPENLTGEPLAMFAKLPPSIQRSALVASSEEDLSKTAFEPVFRETELFLDAIFGTGFHPPLPEVVAALRGKLEAHPAPVISVDLPSGWDADSKEMRAEGAFRSDAAITFTAPKLAHVFGALTRGPVAVAPIGSPQEAILPKPGEPAEGEPSSNLPWTGASKRIIEQPRDMDSHKGRFGHVLVVGGSAGKAGAPGMAALGALRAGAGLVTAAVPSGILPIVAGYAPETMTYPLEESPRGGISSGVLEPESLKNLLRGITVLAVGPGLGREPDAADFARELVRRTELPTVLDADGLNAFETRADLLDGGGRALVLTPHPGEMARLIGGAVADIERDRITAARDFALQHKATVVLKGWRTLVAHPDGDVAVNTSGNPALAKGGSGDVLTGIVAAMIAQFPDRIREAVECAVWLHGAAADRFVRNQDEHTMLATDLLRHLSGAIRTPVEHDGFTWLQAGGE
jgi:NAD(P)H-hydrate epimerase